MNSEIMVRYEASLRWAAVCAASFLAAGCISNQRPVRYNRDSLPFQPDTVRTFQVSAKEPWTPTGMEIGKGDDLLVHFDGTVKWDLFAADCGPDGVTQPLNILNPLAWFPGVWFCPDGVHPWNITGNAMGILRVGKGPVRIVGRELYLPQVREQGELVLGFNEPYMVYWDNDGAFDATVYLRRRDSAGQAAGASAPVPTRVAVAPPVPSSAPRACWAVVIGVSNYKDAAIPSLRYAAADAKAFHEWAVSPAHGRYAPERVKLLLDAQATGANIRRALFDWLGQALEEDLVVIYFAGHGTPQSPDHTENLFLLPQDAQSDDVATTGFPMWDIETALKRFIKAKRVVVIADACHSGGIGKAFEVALRDGRGMKVNPVNKGIQDLTKAAESVCVITAADENQSSQEGEKWGGGHGVFTYYLIKGLTGDADVNKDGHATLAEMMLYLSENVREATRSAQSPRVTGKLDLNMSLNR